MLQRKQVGETIRDLGLQGQMGRKVLLPWAASSSFWPCWCRTAVAQLDNIYIILMLLSTVWLGMIGFLDDYIKVFRKNKEGLSGRFKVLGQVGLGITVGWVLFISNEITVREYLLPNGNVFGHGCEQSVSRTCT